MNFVYV